VFFTFLDLGFVDRFVDRCQCCDGFTGPGAAEV